VAPTGVGVGVDSTGPGGASMGAVAAATERFGLGPSRSDECVDRSWVSLLEVATSASGPELTAGGRESAVGMDDELQRTLSKSGHVHHINYQHTSHYRRVCSSPTPVY
jgi:hypothetical protein